MTIVANSYSHVIGIDTHARTHTLVVIDASSGARLRMAAFAATGPGLARAISFITQATASIVATLVVIEGVGSFGARIAHECTAAGLRVVEPMPTPKGLRAGRGKSDPIDAELIARSVLAVDPTRLRDPHHDHGVRAAIRVLIAGREQLNVQRTATINALTALVRTADLGVDARRPLTSVQIAGLASTRTRKEDIAIVIARGEARRMARQIRALDDDLTGNRKQLETLVADTDAASLMKEPGISTITAATVIASLSHKGRIRSEAAFASLGSRPDPRVLGQHHPLQAQPRRGPAAQPGPTRHRANTHARRSGHPRVRGTSTRRRARHQGDSPQPQALHRPSHLPLPHGGNARLTNIEASHSGYSSWCPKAPSRARWCIAACAAWPPNRCQVQSWPMPQFSIT